MNEEKDTTGYGIPPKNSQFKKGQSGNPKGRPKNRKSERAIWNGFMDETHKTTTGEILTKREALYQTIAYKALHEKDASALKWILEKDIKLNPILYDNSNIDDPYAEIQKLRKELKIEKDRTSGGVLVVPATISAEEWVSEAKALKKKMQESDF